MPAVCSISSGGAPFTKLWPHQEAGGAGATASIAASAAADSSGKGMTSFYFGLHSWRSLIEENEWSYEAAERWLAHHAWTTLTDSGAP